MKKYIKEYTENFSLILLLFYILGFCYQFWFYNYFNIEIEYYINLTDLIFSSLKILLGIIIYFLIIEIVLSFMSTFSLFFRFKTKKYKKYEKLDSKVQERFDRYIEYLQSKNSYVFKFFYCFLLLIIGLILFNDKILFLSLIMPNFVFRLYSIFKNEKDIEFKKILNTFSFSFLFVTLIICYSYWGYFNASNIKNNYTSKVLRIGEIYTGDNVNKFIGETSTSYFILNIKTNIVTIINKENLNKIDIEPNKYQIEDLKEKKEEIKNFIEKIKKYSKYK